MGDKIFSRCEESEGLWHRKNTARTWAEGRPMRLVKSVKSVQSVAVLSFLCKPILFGFSDVQLPMSLWVIEKQNHTTWDVPWRAEQKIVWGKRTTSTILNWL
jgi:hypothetical protein